MTVTSSLKPGRVARQIASFEKRFGQAHLFFAYHAAVPLILTPDLLYALWMNFKQDIYGQSLNIPWFAVVDLLLSSLCDEVGYELYKMKATVRKELLARLQEDQRFGQTRIKELSNFLLDYIRQEVQSDDPYVQNFAKVQRWAGLAYTRPNKTTHELASVFSGLDLNNQAEILRMSSLLENLNLPLSTFQSLLKYARGIVALIRGNSEAATEHLKELVGVDNQIRIAGVKLSTPEPIQAKLNKLPSEKAINFSGSNLRGRSFKGKDLTGADFSYADIRGADFTNTTLIGAKFNHATAGLRNIWKLGLIICSMFLCLSSGIGAVIMGYHLQKLLINPINEDVYLIAVSILPLFLVICIVIFRQGIEATLGTIVLGTTGTLSVAAATQLPEIWNWEFKTILVFAGIIALGVSSSGARLGFLSFMGKWSTRWTITLAIIFGFGIGYIEKSKLFDNYKAVYPFPGIPDGKFKEWLDNLFTSDVDIYWLIIGGLFVLTGLILVEAVGIALAMLVNRTFALTIGIAWIPLWFLFLILSQTELSSVGSFLILTIIAGLGVYVGWQGINSNKKYKFIVNVAVAASSFWFKGTSFRGANLTDADFSSAKLKYVDFSDANLMRISWFQAQGIELACLEDSYLKSTKIRKLVTTGLGQNQNFNCLSLRGLNLSGTNLENASLIATDLSDANLQDANLARAKLVNAKLENTNLTGACLTGACIQDWYITPSTKLDGVECDYIYTQLVTPNNPNPYRYPEDNQKIFEPGDFADFIESQKSVT